MGKCPACGGEISEEMQYCPHCGARVEEDSEKEIRDYWAEQLQQQNGEDDWTEAPEEELPDINENPESLAGLQPPQRRKSFWIPGLLIFLAAACLGAGLFLRRPGEPASVPGTGIYYGCSGSFRGENTENPDDWIRLYGDGSFQMVLTGSQMEGDWQLEGETFRGFMEHRDFSGTLKEGILTFSYSGTEFTFALPECMENVLPGETQLNMTMETETDRYSQWAGDYYGTMIITEGTGGFEGNAGECRDVCGRIRMEEEGTGRLLLWNADNKKWERFCIADVLFLEGATDFGKLTVEWGKFLAMELMPGDWTADPAKSPVSQFNNMIYFYGEYVDPEVPRNAFHYEIFLKPWGESWEDVLKEGQHFYMVPPGYESWYLPMIDGGQTMPENF